MKRAAWIVAAWTLGGVLLAAQAYLSSTLRGENMAWTRPLAIWLTWAAFWALLTPAILKLASRVPFERPHVLRAIAIHTIASIVAVVINLGLFALVAPLVGAASYAGSWSSTFSRLLGSVFFLDLPVYWVLVGAAETIRLAKAAREREHRALRLEAQLAEARLLTLKSQLQPHFLFNALNTVSVLMREDVDAADEVLVRLSALLRRTLDATDAHEVALRDELSMLETYLQIEQTRFADRLTYTVDVDPDVLDARVPPLILQPLVENAIRHGIAQRVAPGRIEIAAARRDGAVHMTVRDNGPGIASDAKDGVGLSNTRARLQQLYGSGHTFRLGSAEGGGVEVSIAIPLRGASR